MKPKSNKKDKAKAKPTKAKSMPIPTKVPTRAPKRVWF